MRFKQRALSSFSNDATVKCIGSNQPFSSGKLESFLDVVGNVIQFWLKQTLFEMCNLRMVC